MLNTLNCSISLPRLVLSHLAITALSKTKMTDLLKCNLFPPPTHSSPCCMAEAMGVIGFHSRVETPWRAIGGGAIHQ